MDDYLKNLLFASNLLKYLFGQYDIPWTIPKASILEDCVQSKFDEEIGFAVYTIWQRNFQEIYACYNELCERNVEVEKNEENVSNKKALRFSKYAIGAADSYFSNGYSSESFLGYCAIILGAAIPYFQVPSNQVPEIAAEVVALVLLAHQITGQFYKHDGWNGLQEISTKFNCLLINSEFFATTPQYEIW